MSDAGRARVALPAIEQVLSRSSVLTIDAATVREKFQRFARLWDDNSRLTDFAALLNQYLSQPLSDSCC